MPNPRQHATFLDQPLDEYLRGATHIRITCTCPRAVGHCGYSKDMLTSELVRAQPSARTYQDFRDHLKCSRCGAKGWASIAARGR
jgi:hypothetical protein